MTNVPELCLGTVQFGLPYGITNQRGQVPEAEVHRMLQLAAQSGIELLDTAQAYGLAETVLGRCWPAEAPRRLISKLPAGAPIESWEASLITSLKQLQTPSLDGFLLHRASDLLASEGAALLRWLEGLRDRGLAKRIGVSIYNSTELKGMPLDRLELVQLPLSVYDQRFISDGTVARLQDLGIAVHVRSVLLQGVLLQLPEAWPERFSVAFRRHHANWLEYLNHNNISPLDGALGFVHGCEGVEAILVGAASEKELNQLIAGWKRVTKSNLHLRAEGWSWDSSADIDPRMW